MYYATSWLILTRRIKSMSLPGFWELMIIFGIVLLLFGAKRLPDLGGAIGEAFRNFRKGVKGSSADDEKKG